jgi:glucose/arabinose dehydrogenase
LVITIIIGINYINTVLSQPILKDTKLKAEIFAQGLKSPTSKVFLGPKDILAIEKDDGTAKRIVNGILLPQPLLRGSCFNNKRDREVCLE